jgi:GNAT superfamily N-acetyltransferase
MVNIREYRAADLDECRRLYAQLVEHHRDIYHDPRIGGADPGSGFDEYLALPHRVMTWVATNDDSLVGLTGLLWEGGESTIEPVVVDLRCRRTGIGRRLIQTAIEESRRRGASDVNINPVARNASVIQVFHDLGFRAVGHVQLLMSLDRDQSYWQARAKPPRPRVRLLTPMESLVVMARADNRGRKRRHPGTVSQTMGDDGTPSD